MTDNVIANWFFASSLAILIAVIAIGLLAYCVWDGWGRYKKMTKELEEWGRRQ